MIKLNTINCQFFLIWLMLIWHSNEKRREVEQSPHWFGVYENKSLNSFAMQVIHQLS